MNTRVLFILEESVGNTEIIVWMYTDWELTWNRIPWVLVHFPDWGITIGHLRHFVISASWPQHLYFLSLGVGHNLSANVGLV